MQRSNIAVAKPLCVAGGAALNNMNGYSPFAALLQCEVAERHANGVLEGGPAATGNVTGQPPVPQPTTWPLSISGIVYNWLGWLVFLGGQLPLAAQRASEVGKEK